MGTIEYPNWLTLYTDASFTNEQKAGWGVWIRHSKAPVRIKAWGSCAGVRDNNVAELVAIIRGVEICILTYPELEGIGLKSDSETAIRWAKFMAPISKRADVATLQKYLIELLDDHEIKLRCRWVKGHQGQRTTPGYLNDHVDGFSRRENGVRVSDYPRLSQSNWDRAAASARWIETQERELTPEEVLERYQRHRAKILSDQRDQMMGDDFGDPWGF